MRLIAATTEPINGLDAFLREVSTGEHGFGGTDYAPDRETVRDFLARLLERQTSLDPGWVPFTTFWLLDDDYTVTGMSRLRHELNETLLHHGGHIGYYVKPAARGRGRGTTILSLTLAEGRERGIKRFLLTVDSDNEPSIRVIEGNGGVLEDERIDAETGRAFRRYWIG